MPRFLPYRCILAVAMLIFSVPLLAAVSAEAEMFQGGSASEPAGLKGVAGQASLRIELPPPETARSAPAATAVGPREVGFGRALPTAHRAPIDMTALVWSAAADGGQTATLALKSNGALGIRAGIRVERIADAAELRFYAAAAADARVFAISGAEIKQLLALDAASGETSPLYWSPIVQGNELSMEIYLPAATVPGELSIAIESLSHLYEPLVASATCPAGVGLRCAESCNIDAKCHEAGWSDVLSAVAKMAYTTASGATAVCSGTLVSDLDSASQIPYFLTARHCISTQSEASSLQTFWFYESASCNGEPSNRYQVRAAGATLLEALARVDMTLLRLNRNPPDGALMAGWDSTAAGLGEPVTGIHHPSGDLKKISFGTTSGMLYCALPTVSSPVIPEGAFWCFASSNGDFLQVRYSGGTTEGGSSGSPVFLNHSHKLVGTLTGGNGACARRAGDHIYGRFDVAYALALRSWLGEQHSCGTLGDVWTYCAANACGPCLAGEGDCDSDSECASGLSCAHDVGSRYGLPPTADVCEASTGRDDAGCPLAPGDWQYCADPRCGPCLHGQGDCDSDNECASGLVCAFNAGARHGLPEKMDVCESR